LSGSYDPGELYWFKGLGAGRFAARQTLCGRDGRPILSVPDQQQKFESFGTWVDAVDWDGDGDPDLVYGCFTGRVMLRLNEGTSRAPLFASANVEVQAGGRELEVPGFHGAIVAADWDGDGRFDLVLGSADGGAYWCRNVGTKGAPAFETPATLVPPHDPRLGNGYQEWLEPGVMPRPGIRAQIDVVDWNGDGKLDLLVGDFRSTVSPRADLTPKERTSLDRLRHVHELLGEKLETLRTAIDRKLDEYVVTFTDEEIATDAAQEKIRRKDEELRSDPDYVALANRSRETWKYIESYLEKSKLPEGDDDFSTAHGHVWLYLRQ